jgi:putative ABC transport system permease protein
MEFGPILRALFYNKSRFWLITVEVALTLAIVANCVNILVDLRGKYLAPTGMDEENLIIIRATGIGPEFDDEAFVEEIQREDLRRLRAHAGILDAASFHQIPLSGGGSSTGRKALGSELDTEPLAYYLVSEGAVNTVGSRIVEGRAFELSDLDYEKNEDGDVVHRNVILSQATADALFPDGNPIGQIIQNDSGEITNTVVGVVERLPCPWPSWEHCEKTMLFPGRFSRDWPQRYIVRTEPGAVDSIYGELEEMMLASNPGRIVRVETMAEIKRDTYEVSLAMISILGTVIGLLIFVTSLGIIGLTAFSVTQRIRQIGTRRALGATKRDILRYFLVENWVITGIGLVVGIGLAMGLNYALVTVAEVPKMSWSILAGGAVLLWVTGVLAALAPALRATRVAPEIATRSV